MVYMYISLAINTQDTQHYVYPHILNDITHLRFSLPRLSKHFMSESRVS